MIHELTFPGGEQGRAGAGVATPRAPSPAWEKLVPLNPSVCLRPLKLRMTTDTYERLRDKLKGSV
jgi:hypothetical protein